MEHYIDIYHDKHKYDDKTLERIYMHLKTQQPKFILATATPISNMDDEMDKLLLLLKIE